jgi:hypothetical protein
VKEPILTLLTGFRSGVQTRSYVTLSVLGEASKGYQQVCMLSHIYVHYNWSWHVYNVKHLYDFLPWILLGKMNTALEVVFFFSLWKLTWHIINSSSVCINVNIMRSTPSEPKNVQFHMLLLTRFNVLMMVTMKITVSWDVTCLVEMYLNFHQTTYHHFQENGNLH